MVYDRNMLSSALAAIALSAGRPPFFGYHVAEVAIKGNVIQKLPSILKACGETIRSSSVIKNESKIGPILDDEDVIAAYFYKGWTHIFDPSYVLISHSKEWRQLSSRQHTRVIAWCCEDTTAALSLYIYEKGKAIRTIDVVDGKANIEGGPVPEERGIKWGSASSEDAIGTVARLGAPMVIGEKGAPYTIFRFGAPSKNSS